MSDEITQLGQLINNRQYLLALKELSKLKEKTTNELLRLQLKQLEHNINTIMQLQDLEL